MLLASFVAFESLAQTAAAKRDAKPIQSSVCELSKHPTKFDGKRVTIHARYFTNWEWGAWLTDARCSTNTVKFLSPGAYGTPPRYRTLRKGNDDGFQDFKEKELLLCNGMSLLCDFDYLEADFTGILVAGKRLSRPENGFVVTNVGSAKLHADEHSLLVPSEVPNVLPDAEKKRFLQ